jgi:hypothetical protein
MAGTKISALLASNEFDDTEITGTMGFEVYDPAGSTDALKSGASVFSKFMKAMWRLYPEKRNFVINGGAAAIATGIVGEWVVPWACTITGVTAIAATVSGDNSGSIVVDIWNAAYSSYSDTVPADGNSITASAPVTITTGIRSQDTTLTGWTTTLAAGSVLRFNVDSCTDVKRLTIALDLRRTA